MQDVGLRAWRGLPRFDGRSSLRSWLYRIATNVCLDAINRRPKRVLPDRPRPVGRRRLATSPSRWSRPVWVEPVPRRAARPGGRLRLAGGELRAARERRAGLHRGAAAPAGEPARDADPARGAGLLGRRGRRHPGDHHGLGQQLPAARPQGRGRRPARAQPSRPRCGRSATSALREIVERYVEAWDSGDPDAVVAMLAEDAAFSMPPHATWFRGRDAILEFLPRGPLSIPRRFLPLRANGQPAFAHLPLGGGRGRWLGNAIHVHHAARRRRDRRRRRLPLARPVPRVRRAAGAGRAAAAAASARG